MNARVGLRARWVALLTVVVLVAGAAGAAAHWTARTAVDSTAAAATVGLDQKLLPASGGTDSPATYSTETPTLSRAVSITNSGSREADYTLTVRAAAPTHSGLPAAIRVAAAPVGAAQDCTPRSALREARTGTLARDLDVTGVLPAGKSITLCVQTSLDAAGLRTFADAQLELQLTTELAYADAERWTIEGDDPMTIAQRVAGDPFGSVEQGTYSGNEPWYLEMGFSQNAGKQGKTSYRVFLAREDAPGTRVLYRVPPRGWDTVVRFHHGSSEIREFTGSAAGGLGNAWVYVEQKVDGEGGWTPVAVGKVRFVPLTNSVGIEQGWR